MSIPFPRVGRILITFWASATLTAHLWGAFRVVDLSNLAKTADAIVVARVAESPIIVAGAPDASILQVPFVVERVLKGTVDPPSTSAEWTQTAATLAPAAASLAGNTGVLFLKRTGTGS